MNRIIKFRAWHKIQKKELGIRDVVYIDWQAGEVHVDGNGDFEYLDYELDDTVLMQFTGLKDKNGVEIFEGDIVKLEGWNPSICEVTFDRGAFCIRFGEDDGYYPDIKYVEGQEVIGNIYSNPELLNPNK